MADFYENKQVTEEVILVGVALGETSVTDESLDELEELAKTAGARSEEHTSELQSHV